MVMISYIFMVVILIMKQKTINLNVKKKTKYYLDFLFCSENYNTVCTNLKVSYNININTSLL